MIEPITSLTRDAVRAFFIDAWGSPEMVISTGKYDCATLDGFVWSEANVIIGLLTYVIREDEIEIISLDSLQEKRGIGSALLDEVERVAKQHQLERLSLITTNDNLRALSFTNAEAGASHGLSRVRSMRPGYINRQSPSSVSTASRSMTKSSLAKPSQPKEKRD
ncbi:GNAT family N-acetyltransferase [Exiguobacterium mexicanum]|uniref:GNAT family N-acetyltransferase n=1 Tax=Exiguobacterium mexicanum TaxID=340146 RepID=UPI0037C19710